MAKFFNKKISLLLIAILIVGGFFVSGANKVLATAQTDITKVMLDAVTMGSSNSITVNSGATISAQVTVDLRNNDDWRATGWRIANSGSSYTCVNHADFTTNGTHNVTFNVTAPTTAGDYDLSFKIFSTDGCNGDMDNFFDHDAVIVLPAPGTIHVSKVTVPVNDTTQFVIDASSNNGGTISGSAHRTNFATNNAQDFSVKAGKTYAVTESLPAGWIQTANTCNGLTPSAGQTLSCTITNTKLGSITVHKNVLGIDGETDIVDNYSFTVRLNGDIQKTVSEETVAVFGNLTPGTYTITENLDGKYQFMSMTPDADLELGGAQIVVSAGVNTDVYITNRQKAATITVIKDVVGPGGSAVLDNHEFMVTLDGKTRTFSEESSYAFAVGAGTFSAVETVDDNYGDIVYSVPSVTVELGGSATITITNKQKSGTLTIIKNVINHEGIGSKALTDFSFRVNGAGPVSFVEGGNVVSVNPGAYVVAEEVADGYAVNYNNCSGNIASNGKATCTIVNNDLPDGQGAITVIKNVINDNGGTATANDFTLKITPIEGEALTAPSGQAQFLNPGSYTVSEVTKEGYNQESIVCTDDGETIDGSAIELVAGHAYRCTVTNNDIAPKLTLNKIVINDDGGSAVVADWNLTASLGEEAILSGISGITSSSTLRAGFYRLAETGPVTGYEASDWSCDGGSMDGNGVAIGLGKTVTCTITNNDKPAKLKIIKRTDGGDGTFSIKVKGVENEYLRTEEIVTTEGSGSTEGTISLDADTYDVIETEQEGWTLTSVNCEYTSEDRYLYDVANLGTPVTNGRRIEMKNGDNITCTFNNTKRVITYNWVTGDWGACDKTCGGGIQSRTVVCKNSDLQIVADENCAGEKPALTQSCNTAACGDCVNPNVNWAINHNGRYWAWASPCDGGCSQASPTRVPGWRYATEAEWSAKPDKSAFLKPDQSLICAAQYFDYTYSHCDYSNDPVRTPQGGYAESWYIYDCAGSATSSWSMSQWGACSASCGGGTQTREVVCKNVDQQIVADEQCPQPKPAVTQACNTQTCNNYSWNTGEWSECSASCGGGTQTRTVTCSLNEEERDYSVYSEENCEGEKPANSQSCNTQSCGGGGGGGGGAISTPCSSVEYDEWQSACVGGWQYRNVKKTIPSGCNMTTAQLDAAKQACGTPAPSSPTGGQVLGEKIVADKPVDVCADVASIALGKADTMATLMKVKRSNILEKNAVNKYVKQLIALAKDKKLTQQQIDAMVNYIVYSGQQSLALGAGERAGVLHSYLAAFGHLPKTESEWCDTIKIATDRLTQERSDGSEKYAKEVFKKKVYSRDPNLTNQTENKAVTVMAYGLRPSDRSLAKEADATKKFKSLLNRLPKGARDWDMVRSMAYYGIK